MIPPDGSASPADFDRLESDRSEDGCGGDVHDVDE
jgi:hypothetical protein